MVMNNIDNKHQEGYSPINGSSSLPKDLIFRVPWVFKSSADHPCLKPYLILSTGDSDGKKCSQLDLDFVFMLLARLLPPASWQKPKLQLIPANGYSMKMKTSRGYNGTNGTTEVMKDRSVMRLIYESKADISTPYMSITAERFEQNQFLQPPLRYPEIEFAYRKVPGEILIVGIPKLFPPILRYTLILVCLGYGLRSFCKSISKGHQRQSKCQRHKIQKFSRSGLVVGLCIQIESAIFTGYVADIFNEKLKILDPFERPGDLIRQVSSGKWTGIARAETFARLLNSQDGIGSRNPVKTVNSYKTAGDLLLSENKKGGKQYVYIGGSMFVQERLSSFDPDNELVYRNDYSYTTGAESSAFASYIKFPRKLTIGDAQTINAYIGRRKRHALDEKLSRKRRRMMTAAGADDTKYDVPFVDSDPTQKSSSILQIQGAFFIYSFMVYGSITTFFVEMALQKIEIVLKLMAVQNLLCFAYLTDCFPLHTRRMPKSQTV